MKMSEYTKSEWKKMKGKPFKERLAYFWDYYKWPTIIALLLVVAVAYTMTAKLNEKETVLSGILIDASTPLEEPAILQEFCQYAGIDTQQQEITLQTGFSMSASNPSAALLAYQRIHAGIAAEDTDFLIANRDVLRQCGYDSSHMLMDLRQFLSPEQLQALDGRLYYVDGGLFAKVVSGEMGLEDYPSPLEPEKMDDPIPVGIHIRDFREFLDSYYAEEPVYFAVACNAPHPDRTMQFLDFIIGHL